jgi:hypothetical protein
VSVEIAGSRIFIVGNGTVGDAEPILAALQEDKSLIVNLAQAAHLHSAIVQLLLALRPTIEGAPAYPLFVAHVLPLLDRGQGPE